eukprot:Opistho-1_new@24326
MDVVDRIAELLLDRLVRIIAAELPVIVHRARDHAHVQRLGLLGLAIDIESEGLVGAIGQPLIEAQAIALGLRDLLALLVEEHLVVEALGRAAAHHARDLARLDHRIDQVLARHLVIDAQRDPAHRPVDLPLQLGLAAQDRLLDPLALIHERDHASLGIEHLDRNLQHDAALGADRQHGRIGRLALGTQRRQHHVHDALIAAQDKAKRIVERPVGIIVGRGDELVVKAEAVEKLAQLRVIVVSEAFVLLERIGHLGQRLAQILRQHLLVRHIVRHLAQAVHVVAERDQPGGRVRQRLERAAHHRRAQHFVERADMRQARRAVAGLEQHRRRLPVLGGLSVRIAFQKLARLLIGPGLGGEGGVTKCGVGHGKPVRDAALFCKAGRPENRVACGRGWPLPVLVDNRSHYEASPGACCAQCTRDGCVD